MAYCALFQDLFHLVPPHPRQYYRLYSDVSEISNRHHVRHTPSYPEFSQFYTTSQVRLNEQKNSKGSFSDGFIRLCVQNMFLASVDTLGQFDLEHISSACHKKPSGRLSWKKKLENTKSLVGLGMTDTAKNGSGQLDPVCQHQCIEAKH